MTSITKPYSTSMPLDLGQFNAVTGGKSTYQEELLELFFQNSAECILVMEKNCALEASEKWRDALEELKNISGSIGAMELSKVCAVAGKMSTASLDEKKKMLISVSTHIQRLRAFVRNTRY